MKKILYILFAVCLFTACSSDDDNNPTTDEVYNTDGTYTEKGLQSMLQYSFNTDKSNIKYDTEQSQNLLSKKKDYSGEPTIFYHLDNNRLKMISRCYLRYEGDYQFFLKEVEKLNPPQKIEIQTSSTGYGDSLKQDSLSWVYNGYKILIRNGAIESLPTYSFLIIEYTKP
ncbi:hypothetical protein [Dysgonomonas sp.]